MVCIGNEIILLRLVGIMVRSVQIDSVSSQLLPLERHMVDRPTTMQNLGQVQLEARVARMVRASRWLLALKRHAGSCPWRNCAFCTLSRFSGPVDTRSHTVACLGAVASGRKLPVNATSERPMYSKRLRPATLAKKPARVVLEDAALMSCQAPPSPLSAYQLQRASGSPCRRNAGGPHLVGRRGNPANGERVEAGEGGEPAKWKLAHQAKRVDIQLR